MARRTFGIEEEFVLLDPLTLETTAEGTAAVMALRGRDAGVVCSEFYPSQVEFATPVCHDAAGAQEAVDGFRRRLAAWADAHGVVAAGSGTPYRTSLGARTTPGERYARISRDIGAIAPEHQINGLHVHVGIDGADEGVRASNVLRGWLPVLLALSANSPFWQAQDTGYASWRAIHSRRWTTHGIPPAFADAGEHRRALAMLSGLGATSDAGTINWNVRVSHTHPTVEVRVCDAQLEGDSAVALALVIRALVEAGLDGGLEPAREPAPGLWDAALWHAARHGAARDLVHPLRGAPAPSAEVFAALRETIAPTLDDPTEASLIDALISRAVDGNAGAGRQRAAHRDGPSGLAALYRLQVDAPPGRGPSSAPDWAGVA